MVPMYVWIKIPDIHHGFWEVFNMNGLLYLCVCVNVRIFVYMYMLMMVNVHVFSWLCIY